MKHTYNLVIGDRTIGRDRMTDEDAVRLNAELVDEGNVARWVRIMDKAEILYPKQMTANESENRS